MTGETESARVARLRGLLPATGAGIYLATAELGPLPAETAVAMREAEDWELRVGRATEGRADDMAQRVEEARAVLAALLVADPSEIVLTAGVDAALALAARSGDPGNLSVLDASLMVGAMPIEASALGVDFVAFACDKWLLGPEQTAALWIGPRARDRAPVPPSSGLGRTVVLGLARSVGWLEMYVGLEWAYERTARLANRLRSALAEAGAEMLPPRQPMAAIVCFRLPAWPVVDALAELRRRVFTIIESTPEGDAIRAGVAWFNTEEELDRFASAVTELAAHTPETLPRRSPLIVR